MKTELLELMKSQEKDEIKEQDNNNKQCHVVKVEKISNQAPKADPEVEADEGDQGEDHQERLYSLLSALQQLARELPAQYQQRISYDLLSALAASLAQGKIVEIVKMMTEVQQVTEKHLFQQRLQFINKHKMEKQNLIVANQSPSALAAADKRFQEELRQHDMKLVTQLDQKVSDQQVTLERAGLPGFYVTNNPTEIQVQMYLLEFILKIGNDEKKHEIWSHK